MAVQITNFHLSFVWVETVPAILERTVDVNRPYAFLGYVGKYAQAFESCQQSDLLASRTVPWPRPRGHHFWKYTFAGQHAGDIDGLTAWNNLVPLRSPIPNRVALSTDDAKATCEIFYSPTGIALVVNAYYRGTPRELTDIVALAHSIRYQALFHPVGEPTHLRTLSASAEYLIGDLRLQAFGDAAAFSGHNQPFSIATFVQGTGVDRNAPVGAGSPEHRVLMALAEWVDDFTGMTLDADSLAQARLEQKTSPADFVYAAKSGRAVWIPREFTRKGGPAPRMSCYHRNLTLSAVRTLLLGEFVDKIATSNTLNQPVSKVLRARAQQATELLEVAATGSRALTYRTRSIERLIRDAKWSKSMEYVKGLEQ